MLNQEAIAAINALDWTAPQSREQVALMLGSEADPEALIEALYGLLTTELSAGRGAAASAIVRLDSSLNSQEPYGARSASEDGRLVYRTLLRSLSHEQATVRAAGTKAIHDHLSLYLKLQSGTFPEWFMVRKAKAIENIREPMQFRGLEQLTFSLLVSQQASALIARLAGLTKDRSRTVRGEAIGALRTIEQLLSHKLYSGSEEVVTRGQQQQEQQQQQQQQQQQPRQYQQEHHQYLSAIWKKPAEQDLADGAIRAANVQRGGPRYTNLTLFRGGRKPENAVLSGTVLREDVSYSLEVAIRTQMSRIPTLETQRPIVDPGQKNAVKILVVLEARGFEVPEPVRTLMLPPSGESIENAWFDIKPVAVSSAAGDFAEIRVRLYYEFNLLDVMTLRAEVIRKFADQETSSFGTKEPIAIRQERRVREYVDLEHIQPRSMHIDITREESHYVFHFLFRNEVDEALVFTGAVRLQASDLEDRLVAIRRAWYELAMGDVFSGKVEGTDEEFLAAARTLAEAGRKLWVALFELEVKSSIREIGQWLRDHPLAEDSILQVSVSADATDFVFPWSLLYDRPLPKESYALPDLKGFWGVRYCVEQRLPKPSDDNDEPSASGPSIKVGFMLWDKFRNATKQTDLMKRLTAECLGKLEVSDPPVLDAASCYKLLADCDKNVLYFYSHGYTRMRESGKPGSGNLQPFIKWYDALPEGSPRRGDFRELYEAVKKNDYHQDRSWIGLTYGMLYLDELYGEVTELTSKPLVILNMCESAQITPSLRDSFVDFFLDRGARSVVGTECPMTVEFADVFSESLFTDLLHGRSIGMAMLNARRKFLDQRNPLGLAYTLYGSAAARFEPPLLAESGTDQ